MSEYQYYEFQALDRHLTQAEKTALGKLSSRVKPTSSTAIFTYSYGDIKVRWDSLIAKFVGGINRQPPPSYSALLLQLVGFADLLNKYL